MEKNGIGHPSNVSFRSPREGRYPLRGPSDRMLPQNQNHASGSGPPLALREAASARGQLSNPLRRHAHATSAPPRNVGGARLLLAPSDHQGAGGRNEAPPPPSAAAGASARSSSAASRHADGNLKNGTRPLSLPLSLRRRGSQPAALARGHDDADLHHPHHHCPPR